MSRCERARCESPQVGMAVKPMREPAHSGPDTECCGPWTPLEFSHDSLDALDLFEANDSPPLLELRPPFKLRAPKLVSVVERRADDASRGLAGVVLQEMERDFQQRVARPWMPSSMTRSNDQGSPLAEWARNSRNLSELCTGEMAASCFEIILLFAARSGVLSSGDIKAIFNNIERKVVSSPRMRKIPTWFKAWLTTLAGPKLERTAYVRSKRRPLPDDMEWGIAHRSDDKGQRVFPNAGDIVFFNALHERPNSHFDHAVLATGRRITRRELTGNEHDDNTDLETEILSFYGRRSREDTCIERTTIEHMLDTHPQIRRTALEGGDRQVFFSTPPWARLKAGEQILP